MVGGTLLQETVVKYNIVAYQREPFGEPAKACYRGFCFAAAFRQFLRNPRQLHYFRRKLCMGVYQLVVHIGAMAMFHFYCADFQYAVRLGVQPCHFQIYYYIIFQHGSLFSCPYACSAPSYLPSFAAIVMEH